MKKLLASIIIVCYLAFSCGVVVNLHYCMGRIDSVKWFTTKSTTLIKCGMMKTSKAHPCCGDEVKIFKIQDDQNNVHASYSIKGLELAAIVPSEFFATSFNNSFQSFDFIKHPPPLLSGQDNYLLNCVFRI